MLLWLFTGAALAIMAVSHMVFGKSADYEVLYSGGMLMGGGEDGAQETVKQDRRSQDKLRPLKGYLAVPLPPGTDTTDISTKNNYLEKRILFTIPGADEDFYQENPLSGDMGDITGIRCGFGNGGAYIELESDEIREAQMRISGSVLYICLKKPSLVYSHVVVIDAGHGGEDPGTCAYGVSEKDITSGTALRLSGLTADLMEKDIRVYVVRDGDSESFVEDVARMCRETGAGLLISLHTGTDSSSRVSRGARICCQDKRTESFGRILSEHLSESTGVDALPPETGGGEYEIFRQDELPALVIELGMMTNKAEALWMDSDDFQQKAADGIYDALEEYFEETTS